MKRLPPRTFLLLVAAFFHSGISAFAAEPFNTPENGISTTVEPTKEHPRSSEGGFAALDRRDTA